MKPEIKNKTLLAVLAHPDDESFGTGGTLALYAQRGVNVFLVCATRGEAGDVDADCLDGFQSIAERREHELRCASEKLGLSGVYFLDYHDSGMPGSPYNQHPQALIMAPLDAVAGRVTEYIRLLKPEVVITFDPIGGYRHPDHIAIHNATVKAFQAAGEVEQYPGDLPSFQPQKLYFQTISKRLLKIAVRVLPWFGKDPHKFGRNEDIDLVDIASAEFPTHAVINYRQALRQKTEASSCHDSQGGGNMRKGVTGWVMRLIGAKETYMRAYPPPQKGVVEKDLFEGII
jgi:LmbE family N-acetylglucosaminyl deacetylase